MANQDFKIAGLWPNKGKGLSGKIDVGRMREALDDGCDRISVYVNDYHHEGDNRPHQNLIMTHSRSPSDGSFPSNPPIQQAQVEQHSTDDIPF